MPNEIKTLDDGKISAKLEDGTIFEGDPLEVTTKLAEAKINTVKWGQEWKAKYETAVANPAPVTPPPATDPNEAQLDSYLLTRHAKALGYNSPEEYKAELARIKGSTEEISKNMAIQSFFTMHPEFPGTEAANAEIGKIFEKHGWEMTPEHLHLAHLEATYLHSKDPNQGYAPLTEAQVSEAWASNMSKANRPAAPPMLRSGSPDANPNQLDPYSIPLNDLRQMAIKQQLEQK